MYSLLNLARYKGKKEYYNSRLIFPINMFEIIVFIDMDHK